MKKSCPHERKLTEYFLIIKVTLDFFFPAKLFPGDISEFIIIEKAMENTYKKLTDIKAKDYVKGYDYV